MTTPREMGWQEAIMAVLNDAEEPLHYREITSLIGEQGLRTLTGANPPYNVRSALYALENDGRVVRAGRGLFALPTVAHRNEEQAKVAESEAESAVQDATRLTVKAYGLYWSRGLVNWETSPNSKSARLLGNAGGDPVNFADQDGVYLLHNGNEIAYVGQSLTPDTDRAGLYARLHRHHNDSRKSDRWDTFSWFGFRPVDDDGQLQQAPENADLKDVIDLVEGILIEGIMPRLNMRRGEGTKAWEANLYNQVEDPQLITNRLAALTTIGSALR